MIQSALDLVLGLPTWLLLVGGLLLLLTGATWMVDGAVGLARVLGISPLIIGLTIVACGTSAPELVVNVIAAVEGNPGLSFGNVIGSNIANIGLVVGVGAIVAPLDVHGRIISRELPWMIGASVLAVALAYSPLWLPGGSRSVRDAAFTRPDGIAMLVGFGLFLAIWFRASRTDARDPMAQEVAEEASRYKIGSPPLAALIMVVGLVALLLGGKLTERGAVQFAQVVGLSDVVIGMTVVAIATSLPELFTVVVAGGRRHSDLALGNVVGSNIFNILLVLGVTCVVAPIPVPWPGGVQDLAAMLLLSVVLLAVAFTHRRSVNRVEGALLLAGYCGYLAWSVLREA